MWNLPLTLNRFLTLKFASVFYSLSSPLTWLNSWPYSWHNGTSTIMPTWPLELAFSSPGKITPGLFCLCSQVLLSHLLIYTVILSVFPLKDLEDNGFISVSSQSLGLLSLAHWLALLSCHLAAGRDTCHQSGSFWASVADWPTELVKSTWENGSRVDE